ncbi:D-cysteine desulfhydrase family protein [Saccharibacillus sp. CPCC 101409]|uniref:D-cysteine desulfhydrase family protein n=1 Tax=Saccharibacillus sp. CPCC 101409 TaxID=3058041 RepID=UPI0026738851|nr:D-cysteine desulfhydrase family protein [Saccharibacillus sp. CPCC 101409]MDO3411867.1 D-cysteine desulfhydrase family protein [Saccharibacillus sp. CPCC 101409]
MTRMPSRISFANLPTRIDKLERLSKRLGGPELYIKRDDQTGTEWSGNKIRKLEYCLGEALNEQADTLITCGGIQSNHCRSTAAAAAKLGLRTILVLRGTQPEAPQGNLLLDRLFGAEIRWIGGDDYRDRRDSIMAGIQNELAAQGRRAYVIPEGASSGLGAIGYMRALEEIAEQERELGIRFDAIVTAIGSGGTYAGLLLGREKLGTSHEIVGFNVSADAAYFENAVRRILDEAGAYLDEPLPRAAEAMRIVDGYVGRGYGLGRPEERSLIREVASLEGIVLDPVYTGKAFYGLTREIELGHFARFKRILFIHTGGLYGLFPQHGEFAAE